MDTGSSAFILICSAMVCLMTPALAFFYGGLGRRKNVINTMMMSVLPLAIASLLWVVAGYSLSFGGHGYFFGNISHLFLHGVSETASSRGLAIPDLLFAAFQMMFSIICVAILTGSVVGRMRFTPLAIFVVFWLLLVYYPFAHMVWGDGILAKWGTIDFAGGDVVHITSGVSALVSPVCFYAISFLKQRFAYDDALDAFGCHGVGGIFGGLVTAIFTTPNLALDKANVGLIYGNARLLLVTVLAIIFTATWSGLVTYGIIKVIARYMPLRVSDRDEAIGLDDCEHKETAYPTFMGMDS